MNNTISIQVRAFPVTTVDQRTGAVAKDHIVLTKTQLQAAQTVGQSSTELICRLFGRQGYHVTDIGKPIRRTVTVDLYCVVPGYIVAEGDIGVLPVEALEAGDPRQEEGR